MAFDDVIEKIGMTIDAAGVVVIVAGAAIAFVASAARFFWHDSDVYGRFLAYASEGAIRRRYHEQQTEQMWCLTSATNAIVCWPTE